MFHKQAFPLVTTQSSTKQPNDPGKRHAKEHITMGNFDFQSLIELVRNLIPMITQLVAAFK